MRGKLYIFRDGGGVEGGGGAFDIYGLRRKRCIFCFRKMTKNIEYFFSYGSELATVTDYYENEDVGKFVGSKGKNKFWIGKLKL